MTPTRSKQIVLVSMLALMVIAVYREKQDRKDVGLFKRIWGTGALGIMLSLLADFAPAVAGPFAGLVVLGALTHGGDQALVNLTNGTAGAVGKVVPQGLATRPEEGAAGHPGTGTGTGTRAAPAPATPAQSGTNRKK